MDKLSGKSWVSEFIEKNINDLAPPFHSNVQAFISALKKSGAKITISATLRPPERAYLMHWSWKIYKRRVRPGSVPPHPNVHIVWVHDIPEKSIAAASAMVAAFCIRNLNVAPSLNSRHIERKAIDMDIPGSGELMIK